MIMKQNAFSKFSSLVQELCMNEQLTSSLTRSSPMTSAMPAEESFFFLAKTTLPASSEAPSDPVSEPSK